MVIAKPDLTIREYLQLNGTEKALLRKMWLHGVQTDTNAIGWLPTAAFDIRAQNNEVTAIHRNDDLVGWTMHSPSKSRGVMKLYQIWVRPDARVIEHGKALVDAVEEAGQAKRCHQIEAWVAEDLPANLFWCAIGFHKKTWRWGRGEKPRKHLLWIRPIHNLSHVARCGAEKQEQEQNV